jgi:hypothetical protein
VVNLPSALVQPGSSQHGVQGFSNPARSEPATGSPLRFLGREIQGGVQI